MAKNWYAALIYAPLFSRPVVVKMLNEWGKEFFLSRGKQDKDIETALEKILEHEIPLILSGDMIENIKLVIEEKGNFYPHDTVITHLAIYSINLLILRAVLISSKYCFQLNKISVAEEMNKLVCIWKYAFQEDDLGNLADFLCIDRDDNGISVSYTPRFNSNNSKGNRLLNLYRVSSSIGDQLIQALTGVMIGDGHEQKSIINALSNNKLHLLSEYQFNTCLNELYDSSFETEIDLYELYRFGEACFKESNVKYAFVFFLMLNFIIEKNIWNNEKDRERFIIECVSDGFKFLDRNLERRTYNDTKCVYWVLIEVVLLKILTHYNINSKEIRLPAYRFYRNGHFKYGLMEYELLSCFNQLLNQIEDSEEINIHTKENVDYILNSVSGLELPTRHYSGKIIYGRYVNEILEMSYHLLKLSKLELATSYFYRYLELKSEVFHNNENRFKYSIKEQKFILNMYAMVIQHNQTHYTMERDFFPELEKESKYVIASISIKNLVKISTESIYHLFFILNNVEFNSNVVNDRFISKTIKLVENRIGYLPMYIVDEIYRFSKKYHCKVITSILSRYVHKYLTFRDSSDGAAADQCH